MIVFPFLLLICTGTTEWTQYCLQAPVRAQVFWTTVVRDDGCSEGALSLAVMWMIVGCFRLHSLHVRRPLQFLLTWPCDRQPKQTSLCLRWSSLSWWVSPLSWVQFCIECPALHMQHATFLLLDGVMWWLFIVVDLTFSLASTAAIVA